MHFPEIDYLINSNTMCLSERRGHSIDDIFIIIIIIIIITVTTALCEPWLSSELKNDVFWDVSPCGSCKNRRLGPSASIIRVTRIGELGTTLAVTSLVTADIVLSSPILVTLMKETLGYSETSVLTRAIRRNIIEDTILHSHRRENFKSYIPQNYSPFFFIVIPSG
jgi:hypothetical protein